MSQPEGNAVSTQAISAFPVVGIGASAGGIEALRSLFSLMPEDTGAGFVLVLHLDPSHDSLIAELLGKCARIPVVQVENGMRVEPNRLHVIPPNAEMTVSDGVLSLNAPQARRGMRMPVDRFFSSLAQDRQEWAIAIVLSGTGSDGTYGVRMVKAHSGMVLAQDPATSGYDGMPRSAMATGDVDYVLPVDAMPQVLRGYIEHLRAHEAMGTADEQDRVDMDKILALLATRQAYDFRSYKRGTINRRILRRMGLNHIASLQTYYDRLGSDDDEVRALAKDLLIGVTRFFREPQAWNQLRETVIDALFAGRAPHEVIRAWVPGCATGEEAYTLAMLLMEAEDAAGQDGNFMVFATDVDREALETARAGVYAESLVADMEADRLARFFERQGDSFCVRKDLREKIVFAPQNLLADPPFSNLSLISCRNLLIYLRNDYQDRLMGLFHFSLRDGGYLFLGSSESPGREPRLFEPVFQKWRIYRRVDSMASPSMEIASGQHRLPKRSVSDRTANRQRNSTYSAMAQKALAEQFAPASVLVDRAFRVLYFHGAVRDYIGPAPGNPSDDLMMLSGEGIKGALREALHRAVESNLRTEVGGGQVRRGDLWYAVRIMVMPLSGSDPQAGLLLVSFEDERGFETSDREGRQAGDDNPTVRQLEEELQRTRAQLRDTLEQMDRSRQELNASNEEVLSINEELQSTNEEMVTSQEELHSLNEELITLNSQLEDKVQELEETTDDLSNLLHSTEIATLFLDAQFNIRRYTPAIGNLMRLIPADIGRAVSDITWRFEDPSLLEDAAAVLAGRHADQKEIHSDEPGWYLRRIMPYRTETERVEGVVITFTDISSRKAMEIALQQSESHLRRIADNMPALISYIDSDLRYRFNNASYEQWFGIPPDAVLGKYVPDVIGHEAFERIRPHIQAVLRGNPAAFEEWMPYAEGGSRYISAQYIPDRNGQGAVLGFFALIADITEKRRIEEQLERLNAQNRRTLDEMRALLDAAPVGIFLGRDRACSDIVMNRAGAEMLRIPLHSNPSLNGPDADKLNFRIFRDGRELKADELPMRLAATQARAIEGFEERVEFADGSHVDLLTYAAPILDADGEVQGCVGTFVDVTRSRQMERMFRETSERLRIQIENTPLGIIEWDRETAITSWSGSAENIFGWSAPEALGTTIEGLGLVHEADAARVTQVVQELLDGRAETNRCRNRNYRKDGTVIWCEWFNSVLRDANGEIVSALSVALDVTERQRLEDMLHERTRLLEEADRRKDVFLAMLGHELRNPLMPIRNVVQLLTMQEGKGVDIQWAAQVIDRQTGHLQRMVDDLLDMARIRRGELNIQKSRLQLRPLLEEAVSMLQPMIEEKGHRLISRLAPEPLTVTGDATRLLQVFSNLLSNAVRYTPEQGEIKLSLVTQADARALITVEDNGNGISSNLLPYVFDIFNQAESHPERSNAGLGLGLSLVKQIVLLHQGDVNVESDGIGKGSCFSVSLPLAEEEIGQSVEAPSEAAAKRGAQEALSILLVDDNPDVRDSLQQLLSAFGHRVSVLDAGRKVVACVRGNPPDLVLLDLSMPDMDGYRVARELAGLERRNSFKVVAVTGYAADPQGVDELHADFDGYLLKPLTLDMLEPYLHKG